MSAKYTHIGPEPKASSPPAEGRPPVQASPPLSLVEVRDPWQTTQHSHPHSVHNRGHFRSYVMKYARLGSGNLRNGGQWVHWLLEPVSRIWMRRAATSASSSLRSK